MQARQQIQRQRDQRQPGEQVEQTVPPHQPEVRVQFDCIHGRSRRDDHQHLFHGRRRHFRQQAAQIDQGRQQHEKDNAGQGHIALHSHFVLEKGRQKQAQTGAEHDRAQQNRESQENLAELNAAQTHAQDKHRQDRQHRQKGPADCGQQLAGQ